VIEIKLTKDSSFIYRGTVYSSDKVSRKKDMVTLSEDVSTGKWFVKQDTLFLDYSPELAHPEKKFDKYLIRRKQLRRVSLTNENAIFHATSDLVVRDE
jgi:hypothetical protein